MSLGSTKTTGTKIAFCQIPTIFPGLSFDADVLEKRLRELAFLNKGVRIRLTDERGPEPRDVEFLSTVGIKRVCGVFESYSDVFASADVSWLAVTMNVLLQSKSLCSTTIQLAKWWYRIATTSTRSKGALT